MYLLFVQLEGRPYKNSSVIVQIYSYNGRILDKIANYILQFLQIKACFHVGQIQTLGAITKPVILAHAVYNSF